MKQIQSSLKKKKNTTKPLYDKAKPQKKSRRQNYLNELDKAIEKEINPVVDKTSKAYVSLAAQNNNWSGGLRKHGKKVCAKTPLNDMDGLTSCNTLVEQRKSQKPRGTSMSNSIINAVKNDPSRENQNKDENRWFGSGRSSCHIRASNQDRHSMSRSKSHSAIKNTRSAQKRHVVDLEEEMGNGLFKSARKEQERFDNSTEKTFTGLKRSTVDRHVPFFKIPSDKISSITETPQLASHFNEKASDSEIPRMVGSTYNENRNFDMSDRYSRNSKDKIKKMSFKNKEQLPSSINQPFRSARGENLSKDARDIRDH